MTDQTGWDAATWEGSRRAQLRRALDLSVRERLQALEDLAETSRRLADVSRIREQSPGSYEADEDTKHVVHLSGCRPTPLASYLKALGVFRLLAEQADPEARGWWDGDEFVINSALDRSGLEKFFLGSYRPTPVVAPWGARSGFYPGPSERSARKALERIESTSMERLAWFRQTIAQIKELLNGLGFHEKVRDEDKLVVLRACRAALPDSVLPWLDACYLLTATGRKFPPLLGTGGNEGSGSYVSGFAQQVVDCIIEREYDEGISAALFDEAVANSAANQTPGQFAPFAAGGPNTTSGFSGKRALNPWDYLLCLEGTILFAAAATRRLEGESSASLSYPFTVMATGSGTGVTSLSDETSARAEMWLPLWSTPTTLQELATLLGEGRAQVGRRTARDGVDFARAAVTFGVDRGITAFQRIGLLQRFGDNIFAVPLDRVFVTHNATAELIDDLDRGGWLERFRRFVRESGSRRAAALVRRLEDGIFEISRKRPDEPHTVQHVLTVLGEIQRYLSSSRTARTRCPPVPRVRDRWVHAADDGTGEFDVARALAGIHARARQQNGRERPVMPLLVNLAPVHPAQRNRWTADEQRRVVWGPGKVERNLGAVLQRRLLDADREDLSDVPLASYAAGSLAAVGAWLADEIDSRTIGRLLPGLVLARIPRLVGNDAESEWPLPVAFRILKPLFCTRTQLARAGLIVTSEDTLLRGDLVRQLIVGDVERALDLGLRRLRTAGLTPVTHHIQPGYQDGQRLLAALMVPLSDRDLRRVAARVLRSEGTPRTSTASP